MNLPLSDVNAFIDELAALRFDCVFNPYAELCGDHDTVDAPAIRRRNLSSSWTLL